MIRIEIQGTIEEVRAALSGLVGATPLQSVAVSGGAPAAAATDAMGEPEAPTTSMKKPAAKKAKPAKKPEPEKKPETAPAENAAPQVDAPEDTRELAREVLSSIGTERFRQELKAAGYEGMKDMPDDVVEGAWRERLLELRKGAPT